MKKVTVRSAAKNIAGRLLIPNNWLPLMHCLRNRNGMAKAEDDAELKLYGQILHGGFLNFGYSENPACPPEKLSLHDIQQSQVRHGERLVDLVQDQASRVLDAGCGMGGLIGLLLHRGFQPTALTPNRTQIRRVRGDYPTVPMIEGKLEQIPLPEFRQAFDTVITSESFQYMKLTPALGAIEQILRPGGRWILCDFFRTAPTERKSGHEWADFTAALQQNGWRITSMEDITANVLPNILFVHMLGRQFGLPLAQFAVERLERKLPALHFLMQDLIGALRGQIQEHLDLVDPINFAREKKYVTLVIER